MSHGAFKLERTYDAPVERVWRALSDREAKAKWFGGPAGEWSEIEREHGLPRRRAPSAQRALGERVVSTFDAVYHDIVPNARLVYSYTMHLNEAKISVSLATMELKPRAPAARP